MFYRGEGKRNQLGLRTPWEDRPPRIIAHWYTDRSEKERKRGEREIKREGWREEEKHGGEALLLTRKRNNSHRRANRTSTQNARSFLAALSTAIFVPPCLRDSSPRWEFIEP